MDTQGDSFFVAFRSASDAVAAAVAVQRKLADHAWPESAEVRVRIGIHSGEAAGTGDRYVGFSVHRAARVGAAAHGGQVLLSDSTRVLVEDDLPAGVSLRDLGLYRLKDVDRPDRLSQVTAEGLPAAFPPLRGAVRVKPPLLRRRSLLAAALAGVLAAAVAIPIFALGSGSGGHTTASSTIGPNSVGVIDAATGRPLAASQLVTTPGAIAAGQKSVWVTSPGTGSVSRIDTQTNTRVGTVPVGNSPTGVAVGGGFVWVTNGLGASVSKIDPNANGGSGGLVDTLQVGNGPSGVAFGARRVWVANSIDRTVTALNPVTRSTRSIQIPRGADAIAYGFGFVWVVSVSANSVTRIEPRSGTTLPPINVGNNPTSITTGSGAVWVTNTQDGTVSRIDPGSGAVTVVPVGGSPTGIAAAAGAVWVSDGGSGKLMRIDPSAGEVAQTLTTANPPGALAVAARKVYVAVGSPARAHRGGTLTVFPLTPELDSIDPATAYSSDDWSALVMTNDGLVTYQRAGGSDGTRIVPDLATSLPTIGDGGRTYTFQVRPGFHYSTGALVRPADVRRGIERSLMYQAGKEPQGAGFLFARIVGASACMKTSAQCDLSRGIVVDPTARTITFHLSAPDPDFLAKLALPTAVAVPANTPLRPRLPLPATGPYRIAHYDAKRGATLVRNPRFREWSPAAQPHGYPDRIVYEFGRSNAAQINAVKRKAADYAGVSGDATALRRGGYGSQLHVNPSFGTDWFFLNTKLPPFNRVAVRRALNAAVDRSRLAALTGSITGLSYQTTCQVLPPNLPGYSRFCPYPLDLARARRLVAASGTRGQVVTVPTGLKSRALNAYLVSVLRDLGYRARLEVFKSLDAYGQAVLGSRRYQLGHAGWFADYPASSQFFTPLFTCAAAHQPLGLTFNITSLCVPRVDREINAASSLQVSDPQGAAVLWSKVDRDVMQQAPVIPIGNLNQADLISRRVGNYQYNPFWGVLLDQLWVR